MPSPKKRAALRSKTPKLPASRTIDFDQELTATLRQAAAVFNGALKNAYAAGLLVDQITGQDGDDVTSAPASFIRIDEIRRRYK
jgi:hypothetical protein